MVDFRIDAVTRVLSRMSQCTLTIHFITHGSYITLPLRLFLQLLIVMSALFFCSSIWCVTLAFVVRTNKARKVHRNVLLGRVRLTVVTVQKQEVLHILNMYVCVCVCVCSLSCPAYKTHMLCYIVVCGLSGPASFSPPCLTNGTVFVKAL